MKRFFDFGFALFCLLLSLPVLIAIYCICKITDEGPFLYWSKRIGIHSSLFLMPKIRTMRVGTPQVATHLLVDSKSYLTPMGPFLRKTSLDELPQLISILKGDMSFVGPRPALFNQDDLMDLRRKEGLDGLAPGLTGWAQINGRDEISIEEKVRLEKEYLERKSFWFDLQILGWTFIKVLKQESVKH